MIKSKTKIEQQTKRKTNSELVETIREARKQEKWIELASILSNPRRKKRELNLDQLNKETGNETLLFPGKILSLGEANKKFKIVALKYSEKAEEKLKRAGCQISYIIDEIKTNPSAKGVKIIK